MKNYAAQAAQTLQFTNALITTYAPIVKADIRDQWERFASSENTTIREIVNETANFMSTYDQFYGPLPSEYNWSYIDRIYNDLEMNGIDPSNTTQELYIPDIQVFPIVMMGYGPANYGM
jgi:hypothetical protein